MPTYEYKCNACGHRFELFQSMTASPVRTCPECGKRKVERLIGTGAAVMFKGSGFYQTDYRSESYRKAAEADSKAAAPAGESGGEKAKPDTPPKEAKPAASSDPAPAKAEKGGKSDKADRAAKPMRKRA